MRNAVFASRYVCYRNKTFHSHELLLLLGRLTSAHACHMDLWSKYFVWEAKFFFEGVWGAQKCTFSGGPLASCWHLWTKSIHPTTFVKVQIHQMSVEDSGPSHLHSLRELRDIALDCTAAPDEPLDIAVDSCFICQIVPMNILSSLVIHFNM